MFITFEGIDYSGKSTQAKLLVERLQQQGDDVMFLREPGGTAVSEKIRTILLDKKHLTMSQTAELLLFSAARSQLVQEIILPGLAERKIVVCDRFYDSTTAYQGYGRGLNLDHIRLINEFATSGLLPDVTFIVEIPVEEIARRRSLTGSSPDRMESSGENFYRKVFQGYRSIASAEPRRCVLLDGLHPVEQLHEKIWTIIQQRRV
jgi:dTMP kinase